MNGESPFGRVHSASSSLICFLRFMIRAGAAAATVNVGQLRRASVAVPFLPR